MNENKFQNENTTTTTTTPRLLMTAFSQLYTTPSSSSSAASASPKQGMKNLVSIWNNVKFGWSGKIKTNFSKEQPVWLLGRCYHPKTPPVSCTESFSENSESGGLDNGIPVGEIFDIEDNTEVHELALDAAENAANNSIEYIDEFRRDFFSRLWITYRREFPTMNDSNYTSDCGWGCMLRSGQMLLAQGLIFHFLGRNWRWDPETQLHSTSEDNYHRKIIRWFGDSSSRSCPFSIHQMVTLGQYLGKRPGDWYGPSSVSYLLQMAMQKASEDFADLENIVVYVAKDCTVYIQDIIDDCSVPDLSNDLNVPWQKNKSIQINSKNQSSQQIYQKAVIILIPLRLGNEKLNIDYAEKLKNLLSNEYCIGIIGGRPKHSLYFVGFQEDKLIHLDPHYCQDMIDVTKEDFPVHSFHCKSPRKLKSSKMDPSCCIGFYCATKQDLDIFTRGRSADVQTAEENLRSHTPIIPFRQGTYRVYNDTEDSGETEEFVIM
ncbi:ATG4C family protein [Megaselia abdita]